MLSGERGFDRKGMAGRLPRLPSDITHHEKLVLSIHSLNSTPEYVVTLYCDIFRGDSLLYGSIYVVSIERKICSNLCGYFPHSQAAQIGLSEDPRAGTISSSHT